MSNKLFFFPVALFAALLLFAPACGEVDPCKDVECGANGSCFEGECVCNVGFEGTACADEWAAKFLGSYLGSDVVTRSTVVPSNVGTYKLNKPAVISKKTGTRISIANFGGFDSLVEADISLETASATSANKITINFTDPTGRKFAGTGTYSARAIKGSYTVTYSNGTLDEATFDYKQ
jgi:hypothetical protein